MTAVTAAVGLAMISQPATARTTASAVRVQKVSIADLDLNRQDDAGVLIARVQRAARAVCLGDYQDWEPYFSHSRWYRGCIRQASNRAVASLGNPMVTAVYEGGPRPIRLAANSPQ